MKKIVGLKGISLFSSAGIGETYLKELGITMVAANELIARRAECYRHFYPKSEMIAGDIKQKAIKDKILSRVDRTVKLLIATPPCQGISTLGKNKSQAHFEIDSRNYLIFDTFQIIDEASFDYILIENVPRFLQMSFPFKKRLRPLEEILKDKYGQNYTIEARVLDAKDYGVPQTRPRAIIKIYKKGLRWDWPKKEREITLLEAISHLPSLESGEKSDILWHFAKQHNERAVRALKHTPTGGSALNNKIHYPKKANGEKIKGFHNTFTVSYNI